MSYVDSQICWHLVNGDEFLNYVIIVFFSFWLDNNDFLQARNENFNKSDRIHTIENHEHIRGRLLNTYQALRHIL